MTNTIIEFLRCSGYNYHNKIDILVITLILMFLENLLGSQYSCTLRVVEVDALNFMAILSSCWVEIY